MYTNRNQRVYIFLFACYNYNRGLYMDYFERYKKLKETHPIQYSYFISNFGGLMIDFDIAL